ncbi:SDR family NAD(P)-dependent oxidoreductase [Salicibibacter cibi]|uniref:SDR family NAD(P)-dependent oxidoreductase n=1 Tax=Salicibibacter cibi TaxID=2743001 RepID=A0A7T6ZBS6_9BACI|nr:SDR family NAD(P)-dependent oxidoreductase [Salicibibacter cibi]QQK80427.1 SDR family NAD(P)-dependent oxidoreductase [Salicibibacter cibi]
MATDKKVAVVTGAAQGIGLYITEKLADDETIVIMTDVLQKKVEEESKLLRGKGKSVVDYVLDVGVEEEIENFFDYVRNEYGRLDILVNNAGISPKYNGQKRMIVDTTLEEWNRVLNVNITGSFLCVREALSLMMLNNWGRIVNMSSQAGRTLSRVAGAHYSTSKSALIGFNRSIASEYGEYGITANCIAPGRIISPW